MVLSVQGSIAMTDPVEGDQDEFGAPLSIQREIDVTNDTIPEVLRIETTRAKRFEDIKVKLVIYSKGKAIYSDEWKAEDYFEARDTTSNAEKWYRLQRILNDYFLAFNRADVTGDAGRATGIDLKSPIALASWHHSEGKGDVAVAATRSAVTASPPLRAPATGRAGWRPIRRRRPGRGSAPRGRAAPSRSGPGPPAWR